MAIIISRHQPEQKWIWTSLTCTLNICRWFQRLSTIIAALGSNWRENIAVMCVKVSKDTNQSRHIAYMSTIWKQAGADCCLYRSSENLFERQSEMLFISLQEGEFVPSSCLSFECVLWCKWCVCVCVCILYVGVGTQMYFLLGVCVWLFNRSHYLILFKMLHFPETDLLSSRKAESSLTNALGSPGTQRSHGSSQWVSARLTANQFMFSLQG